MDALQSALPPFAEPELATLVDAAPEGDDWLHELKFDGYRLIAHISNGRVRLLTRRGNDWTRLFPALQTALAGLGAETAVLDGEVVAFDSRGVSNFQLLQASIHDGRSSSLVYELFDLLYLNGRDLTDQPLEKRKEVLAALLDKASFSARLRLSKHVIGNGKRFCAEACQLGLEGIISKRRHSVYRPGRGRDWLKIKCFGRQELVVAGYTNPSGSRKGLGALILATRDRAGGDLRYAGKVGTGFTHAMLVNLHHKLLALERVGPTVDTKGIGSTKGIHWVEPKLVVEVAYSEMTRDGRLRHPSFLGIRLDKRADDVVLEQIRRTLDAKRRRVHTLTQ